MKQLENIDDLREAIATHAESLAVGDNVKAEAFALPRAIEDLSSGGG